jgi:hypothetical protein
VNVGITGSSDTATAFNIQSGPVLIPAGTTQNVLLTNTFSPLDQGLIFHFQVKISFTTNTSTVPTDTSTFLLAFNRTFSFRIR